MSVRWEKALLLVPSTISKALCVKSFQLPRNLQCSNRNQNYKERIKIITVFPVKPWTPEKISGMFIVSRPIRCKMKPPKITDKPQNGLIRLDREQRAHFFFHEECLILLFSNTETFLSLFQLCCHQRIDMDDILRKSEVNQEDRIRHS